jgi:hypothetical protein
VTKTTNARTARATLCESVCLSVSRAKKKRIASTMATYKAMLLLLLLLLLLLMLEV